MRKKIYKWNVGEGSRPLFFFDLYEDEKWLYSLHGFGLGRIRIFAFNIESDCVVIDEKEVPEEYVKTKNEFITDPFFEIELERFICAQKS